MLRATPTWRRCWEVSRRGPGWGRRETSGSSTLSGGTSGSREPQRQPRSQPLRSMRGYRPRKPARCQELERPSRSRLKSELCSGLHCWVWAYLGTLLFPLEPPEIFQPGKMESASPWGCPGVPWKLARGKKLQHLCYTAQRECTHPSIQACGFSGAVGAGMG